MKRINLLCGHPVSYSMYTGSAVAEGKAGNMMLTTDIHLVQRLIMRKAGTFPVITPPQEGFRLDVRLVSLIYNKSFNRAAEALLPGKYLKHVRTKRSLFI
jgi:hypothetical protein